MIQRTVTPGDLVKSSVLCNLWPEPWLREHAAKGSTSVCAFEEEGEVSLVIAVLDHDRAGRTPGQVGWVDNADELNVLEKEEDA